MGRNSGFIACHAALASREVDCCLVPEEPFVLRGSGGVLEYLEATLDKKGSCVIVVAEGAGHEIYGKVDIGHFVLDEVKAYFTEKKREISSKYLDPYVKTPTVPTSFEHFFFRYLLTVKILPTSLSKRFFSEQNIPNPCNSHNNS